MKKSPLGRGIESLIPRTEPKADNRIVDVDITDIIPNDKQPRTEFDKELLNELAESIKTKGLMQPPVAIRVDNKYMLISGERRWRASALAGLKQIPLIIMKDKSENERLELALIENTQREDLNPLDLANAYKNLMTACGYRQEDVAKVAGKSRSAVANTMRLLDLTDNVLEALEQKKITEGHARVFLTLDKPSQVSNLLNAIQQQQLSVRKTESYAKKLLEEKAPAEVRNPDPDLEALEQEIKAFFGYKAIIKAKKNGGVIEIKYDSSDDLNDIIKKLRGEIC